MKKKISINLVNTKTQIKIAQNEITNFCKKNHLSENLMQSLNLIIDEIMTNTIQYGYNDNKEHNILIELTLEGDKIKIIYTDDGKQFDPTNYEAPTHIKKSLQEKPVGGLGIHLVKSLADSVFYKRRNGKNILILTKKLNTNN